MNKVIDWAKTHPKLSMWIVLGLSMVAIISYEARDVGLLAGQWVALIVATVLVSGLCVWIIGWEDDEEETQPAAAQAATSTDAPTAEAPKKNGKKK